jgi:hypothetical protein
MTPMILTADEVQTVAEAAEIATFGVLTAGGSIYAYGYFVPIKVRVMAEELPYQGDEEEYRDKRLIRVQAEVKSRTRNSVVITDFGWIPRSSSLERAKSIATKTVGGVREFLPPSDVSPQGLEVPGHTERRLTGTVLSDEAPAEGIDVVVVVAGRPFIEKVDVD